MTKKRLQVNIKKKTKLMFKKKEHVKEINEENDSYDDENNIKNDRDKI